MRQESRSPGAAAIVPLLVFVLGLVLWAITVIHTQFKLEDAYITFRYSANIAKGAGFVFNPGERVLGTTTPLQTLILALLAYPFGPHAVPAVASIIMPIFGLLAGLVLYCTMVRRQVPISAACLGMGLLYTSVEVIRTGIGGMETPLALLLMALSLWALIRERPIATGVFCGLLALCRIDGLIWVMLIFGAALLRSRKSFLVQGVAFVLTMLPWIVFATLYFGSPVPNSMVAKGVVRPGMVHALFDPARVKDYILWFVSGTGIGENLRVLPFWAAILAVGAWRVLKNGARDLSVLVVYPFVYAVMMYLGRAPRYEWYLLPITFVSLPVAAIGLYEIYQAAASRVLGRNMKAVSYVGAALVIVIGAGYCSQVTPVMLQRLRMAQENEDGFRRVVGIWLKDHAQPGDTVAMEAIGYQGYYSEMRVIDMAGLVTPRAVEFKRRTRYNGQIFDWVLRDFKPDYIVLRSFEVDTNRHFNGGQLFRTPEKEKQFHAAYKQAARFEAPYPDSAPLVCHLTVYQRVQPAEGG